MRVFALEPDNSRKGIGERKGYIEGLIARLPGPGLVGMEAPVHSKKRIRDIPFHGQDILPGNRLFRQFILKPDTEAGIRMYEEARRQNAAPRD